MKNLTKIFMAVAAGMLAFSCVTDATDDLAPEVGVNGGEGQYALTLSLDKSRTILGEKGTDGIYPVSWCEDDVIAVNGVTSTSIEIKEEGKLARFTFGESVARPFNVVYPAPAAEVEPSATTGLYPVTFMAEQSYTAGSFCDGAAVMCGYATADDAVINMQHLTGVLRVAPYGEGVVLKSITFKSQLGKIAGTFDVNCATGDLVARADASNSITLDLGDNFALAATAEAATPIYVAVPAGEYGLFTLTLRTENDSMTIKFDSKGEKYIKAGVVREFGAFQYTANEAGGDEFLIETKEDLMEFAQIAANFSEHKYTTAKLAGVIDMTGEAWEPIEGFNHSFDGNKGAGCSINGLSAPLFGETGATIFDLNLEDVNIVSNGRLVLGAVACKLTANGRLYTSHTSGSITVSNPDTVIAEDADLVATVNYGGMVGILAGEINGCVNEANITVNQVASSSNTLGVYPGIAGIVANITSGGVVENCVNGNVEKTTGLINYHDNCETKLYAPHIGGIASYISTATISNSTNYGALDFNAKASGTYSLTENSEIIMGGIVGYSAYSTHEGNNNYGTLTVSGGDVVTIIAGGFGGEVINPAKCYNNHNKQGGNITVEEALTFRSLNVAGIVGTLYGKPMESCSNDAPIVSKASTASDAVINSNAYYRVAGITTYTGGNGHILNCENKANGDITVSGNVTLLRNNAQAGVAVVGGVAYYAKADGKVDGIINRGDINVYTNFSMHSGLTNSKYGKLTIAGSVGYITGAEYNIENYGNITIGKKDVVQTITANGILIAGATAWKIRAYDTATNTGNITIANKVTLANAVASDVATSDDADNSYNIHIAGGVAYAKGDLGTINNSGKLDIACTMNEMTYIGGLAGYANAATNNSTNSGSVVVGGAISSIGYIAGGVAYAKGALNTVNNTAGSNTENPSCVNISANITGKAYIGGLAGYAATTSTSCNNSASVTVGGTLGAEGYIGGGIGYANGALNTVKNLTGGKLSVTGTVTGYAYIGGVVGAAISTNTSAENAATITVNGTMKSYLEVGGIAGYTQADTTGSNNSGSVTVGGTAAGKTFIAGGIGYAKTPGKVSSGTNTGAVSVSATTSNVTYVGGYCGVNVGEGGSVTGVSNSGDVTYSGNTNGYDLSLGGLIGGNDNATTYTNCSNSGTVTLTKDAKAQKKYYIGGIIGWCKNSTFTSCTNSAKEGVEYGIVVSQTYSRASQGGTERRIGCVQGFGSSASHFTDVSNSANLKFDGYQLGTGGLSLGGISGTIGSGTTVSGTISNSGDIYYAGRCSESNFGLGGVFCNPGSNNLTGANIICTGDIYVVKGVDIVDHIPPQNINKRIALGGIVGYATTLLENARYFGNIYVIDWHQSAFTTGNVYSLIGGENNTFTKNCHVGGTIYDKYDQVLDVVTPTPISRSNYFQYINGAQTMDAETAKANGCGYISSIDATPIDSEGNPITPYVAPASAE